MRPSNAFDLFLLPVFNTKVLLVCLAWSLSSFSNAVRAQEKSDLDAQAAIFADQHTLESWGYLYPQLRNLAPEDCYRELSKWVLPNDYHPNIRLDVDFVSRHVAAFGTQDNLPPNNLTRLDSQIVSPAYMLVDSAKALGILQELQSRIEASPVESTEAKINRLAMLCLVKLADSGESSSIESFEELFHLILQSGTPTEHAKRVAILVAARTDHQVQLRELIADALHRIVPVNRDRYNGTQLHRYLAALIGHYNNLINDVDKPNSQSKQWYGASQETAATQGRGYPMARWMIAPGLLKNTASHDKDSLYFSMPLRGDFEVECDMTFSTWRECDLLYSGRWVSPFYNRQSTRIGNLHRHVRVPNEPILSDFPEWNHYRLVVRDQTCQWYFNGRMLFSETVNKDCDPWLAIRSNYQNDGTIKNLRISGAPTIPDEVPLCNDDIETSWIPYHSDDTESRSSVWTSKRDKDNSPGIQGTFCDDLPQGCNCERAIFYHRPMFEDGTIKYEFYFDPERSQAHVALDQTAFLLGQDGIRLHPITDGAFDRTGQDPGARLDASQHRRGDGILPLRAKEWNKMRVDLNDNVLKLILNSQFVYEQRLEESSSRRFGLFYFCDQSDLRVRNLVWRGNWPRAIPDVPQQELAGETSEIVDAKLPELKSVFEHDFAKAGYPRDKFITIEGDSTDIQIQSDGLHLRRIGKSGYRTTKVAANISVHGDYDIAATFESLASDPVPDGGGTIGLFTASNQFSSEEFGLLRRVQNPKRDDTHYLQCLKTIDANKKEKRTYFGKGVCDATAGTLRIARRDDQVYYLFADNDSSYYRLIGQETCSTDDLLSTAVHLMAQIHGSGGSTSVVWKKLAVRAEKLIGPAIGMDQSLLNSLNEQRAALPRQLLQDFTVSGPDTTLVSSWNDMKAWNKKDGGLTITAVGRNSFVSYGIALRPRLEGNFDIEVEFDTKQLDRPSKGQYSQIYLQTFFADADRSQANVYFRKYDDGSTEVCGYEARYGEKKTASYKRVAGADASTVSKLRLARRDKTIYFIATSPDFVGEQLIGQSVIGDSTIDFNGTQLHVSGGGYGTQCNALIKSIRIYAQELQR